MVAEWISEESLYWLEWFFGFVIIVTSFCFGAMFQQFVSWVNEEPEGGEED